MIMKKIFPAQLMLQFLFSSNSIASPFMSCSGAVPIKVSSGMSKRAHHHFNSNMTLKRNLNKHYGIKFDRVLNKIKEHKKNRFHKMPLTDTRLAQTILWATECTGNDFQVFTSILEVESYICGDRTGPNGDSGCSMFTGDAIRTFKNQMKLSGRMDNDASPRSTKAFYSVIRSCYEKYERSYLADNKKGLAKKFISLFSGSHKALKRSFVRGDNIHADLLAGAIFLKFKSALAGGYWVPGRRPGGVYSYNASKHARKYSRVIRSKSKKVNLNCDEDFFIPEVIANMCSMEEDNQNMCLDDFLYEYKTQYFFEA